jgi:hypothetical protein
MPGTFTTNESEDAMDPWMLNLLSAVAGGYVTAGIITVKLMQSNGNKHTKIGKTVVFAGWPWLLSDALHTARSNCSMLK